MASDEGKVGMVLGAAALVVLLGGIAVVFATKDRSEDVGAEVRPAEVAAVDAPDEEPVEGAVADAEPEAELDRLDTGGSAAALAEPGEQVEVVPDAPGDDAPPTDPEPGVPAELEGELADQATLAMEQAIGDGPKGDTGLKGDEPPAPKKKKARCEDQRVVKKDGVYHIPRSILDGYATSPGRAGELGSFWWGKNKKGQKTGVKMGKLPCPGLLKAAGFRRGDLVLSVNGAKPTSIARAVSIYSSARSKGTAEVIVRRGKKGKKKKVRLKYRFTG